MRVVVIGGSGHIGTYLMPMLVEAGHEVFNVTRGKRQPYGPHAAWERVQTVIADRDAEDDAGTFAGRIRDLTPDAVIDLICFRESSVRHLVDGLRDQVQHFLHCGTIWTHGYSTVVPATEDLPRRPFGEYGMQKAAIEAYLLDQARRGDFPATVLHPGHIVGVGWMPLNPAGNFNPAVFTQLARGELLLLPNFGMETVHHVHAEDVALAFMCAMTRWSASIGESFHIVSPAAITLRGFAEAAARWFGREAQLGFLPWPEWRATVAPEDASATWEHIARSPNASIAKAQQKIEFQPRYSSLEAVHESVEWLVEQGLIQTT